MGEEVVVVEVDIVIRCRVDLKKAGGKLEEKDEVGIGKKLVERGLPFKPKHDRQYLLLFVESILK